MKKTLVIVLALALIAILAIVLIPKIGAKPVSEPAAQEAQEAGGYSTSAVPPGNWRTRRRST